MAAKHYVVQTKACHEAIVHAGLMAKGFSSQNFTVVYEGRVGHGKRYTVTEPLFPGYVFVSFDRADPAQRWRTISAVRGVVTILGADAEHPTAIPDGKIAELVERFAAGEFQRGASSQRVVAGDQVVIEKGAFSGHTATCTVSRGERLRVLLTVFGHVREVDLDAESVSRRLAG